MKAPHVASTKPEMVVIKGFQGEEIEVTIEQLEDRIAPDQSTAGFLD